MFQKDSCLHNNQPTRSRQNTWCIVLNSNIVHTHLSTLYMPRHGENIHLCSSRSDSYTTTDIRKYLFGSWCSQCCNCLLKPEADFRTLSRCIPAIPGMSKQSLTGSHFVFVVSYMRCRTNAFAYEGSYVKAGRTVEGEKMQK